VLTTIDAHAGGALLRIITHGAPRLRGTTMRERLNDMRTNHDDVRRQVLLEPRGHADMSGALLVPPVTAEADYGVIFMTTGGYSWLSGHGIIALTTALIETGAVPYNGPDVRVTYDTVVGPIQARATVDQGRVLAVRFRNVPAFRTHQGLEVPVGERTLHVDIAFGGAWYAIVTAEELNVALTPEMAPLLVHEALAVRRAVSNLVDVVHPDDDDLAGLYGTVITGPAPDDSASIRSATVYANGSLDRSACGTGTSALIACQSADGELEVGDTFINESLIGSTLSGRIVVPTTIGELPGVVTEISGRGAVVGMSQLFIDPTDVFHDGFMIR